MLLISILFALINNAYVCFTLWRTERRCTNSIFQIQQTYLMLERAVQVDEMTSWQNDYLRKWAVHEMTGLQNDQFKKWHIHVMTHSCNEPFMKWPVHEMTSSRND